MGLPRPELNPPRKILNPLRVVWRWRFCTRDRTRSLTAMQRERFVYGRLGPEGVGGHFPDFINIAIA